MSSTFKFLLLLFGGFLLSECDVFGVENNIVSVLEYGAVGDGIKDNHDIFNKAVNDVGDRGGGVVWVPAGHFYLSRGLTIPEGVSLVGTFRTAPSHHSQTQKDNIAGSVIFIRGPPGNESDPGFFRVKDNAALEGLVFYYPETKCGDPVTTSYPFTVDLVSDNAAIRNCECLNCYNFIRSTTARFFIENVQGQPLNIGVFIDEMYDIGRVENAHWNPWWCSNDTTMAHQLTNGRAFVFGRSDWVYVFNTFSYGYAIGYHFIQTETGACNGNFVGIGADMSTNYSVKIDYSQGPGILIVNGEFTSFENIRWGETKYGTNIYTGPGRTVLKVSNSAFWGPMSQNAHLTGAGTIGFDNCVFDNWDSDKIDSYSIDASEYEGTLTVTNNNFQKDHNQVYLGSKVKSAAIIGNTFVGQQKIVNNALNSEILGNVQIINT